MESDEEFAGRRVGRSIDQFRLERVLGVGGMAAVYAARAADGTPVAVKVLHPDVGIRGDVRERFFREGFIANHLGHPAVVRALGYGDAGPDGAYLVLELLEGETLSARVRRHGVLPPAELFAYADEILDALSLAHASSIVHRDLKPENLFLTRDGRIKILDFGLARVHDALPRDHRTRSGIALGTFPYMAPEQALGRHAEIDGRTDLFALGATLFRLISGRKIHEAASEAELLIAMASKPAPSLAEIAPATALPVVQVVDLALAYGKDARYPDARTMQTDVRAVRAGLAPPYAAARFAEREQKTRAEPIAAQAPWTPAPAPARIGSPVAEPARKSKSALPWVFAATGGLTALTLAGLFLLGGDPPPPVSSRAPVAEPAPPSAEQSPSRVDSRAEPGSPPVASPTPAQERAIGAGEPLRARSPSPRASASAAGPPALPATAAPSTAVSGADPAAPAVLAAPVADAPGALEQAAGAGGTAAASLAASPAEPKTKPEAAPASSSALPALRKRRPRKPLLQPGASSAPGSLAR